MINAKCLVKIGEENFEIIANVGRMIEIERLSGKTFMQSLKDAEKGSISSIAMLLASCLCKDETPVGMKFVEDMDFDVFDELTNPLIDTILKAFPDKKSGKKKVTVLTKMK